MPLPPPQDQHIPLAAAAGLTRAYRQGAGPTAIKASMFFRQYLEEMLAQPGVAGVRVYFGQNVAGAATLVMVGVDQNGNDVTEGTILNNHVPCPPFCDVAGSALNG
ncbi:MAG: hypothetical protein DMD43_10245 [Gemmatimonadetes bacterium]|nr:MAG: hypothetical protein DMD43_10245 [Gemmatimonadota bacterium]